MAQPMLNITVKVDDRELKAATRELGPRVNAAMAKALNRTAFEMIDAEKQEAETDFTLRRLRPAFRFDPATQTNLEVLFMPLPLSEKYLGQHVAGGTVTPQEGPARLEYDGLFAVPLPARPETENRPRGRILKRFTPINLVKTNRGFVASNIVFLRTSSFGRRNNIALFALVPTIDLPRRFKFYEVASATAQKWFTQKAQEEFEKAMKG